MSIKNTRLQTSFNKDVNVTLPFASISSVYFAAKNLRANGQYDDEDEDEEPTTLSNQEFDNKIQNIVANSEHVQKMCSITRENFIIGEKISITPCGHLFKTASIKEYLTHYGNNCPMCRHEFN